MKKIILMTTLALTILSCGSKDQKDYIILAGQIENTMADSVFVIHGKDRQAIPIENGAFRDTIHLSQATYFQFYAERERTDLFLQPGDSLFLTTNMEDFDQELTYTGELSPENNFLAKKILLEQEAIYKDTPAFFSADSIQFQQTLTALSTQLKQELKNSQSSDAFQLMEEKNIDSYYYLMLLQYPMAHSYFTQTKTDMPSMYEQALSQVELDNEKDFESIPAYRDLVIQVFAQQINELEDIDAIEKTVLDQKSNVIKDALMENIWMGRLASANEHSERSYHFIEKESTNDELKADAKELFEKIQKILPGKPSPKFNYPNVAGENLSLDDLKGKLVYIDVWATWCGPCIREIPSLKSLAADYKDKDVAIVSISIDPEKDHEKWLNMVKEKDLQGYQIFADKDWHSDFVRDYNIEGIPRFILLDQEGKIILANAPRPSDEAIRDLFDQHLES